MLRAAETTINNVAVFQSYRAKQGGPSDQLKWRQMRKGVADLLSRAEVSQRVNNRLMKALASVAAYVRSPILTGSQAKAPAPPSWINSFHHQVGQAFSLPGLLTQADRR